LNPERTVVVVDDEPLIRIGLRTILEADGFTVYDTGSAGEALRMIGMHEPAAVTIDLAMPEIINGLELIRNVKTIFPATRTVALTSHSESGFRQRAFMAGASAFLDKRAVVDLSNTISDMVDGTFDFGDPTHAVRLLSEAERRVLDGTARGLTNRALGNQLGCTERTVTTHRARIHEKLGVSSTPHAVAVGIILGEIDGPHVGAA